MKWGDSKSGYGTMSMLNHWVIGSVVVLVIAGGLLSTGMDGDPRRSQIIGLHKATGVLILLLAAWRIAWRLRQGFPDNVPGHPPWQTRAAWAMHWFLMIAIVLMPLSGLLWSLYGGRDVSVFGLFSIPGFTENEALSDRFQDFHRVFSKLLIAAIGVHSLAGIYSATTDFSPSSGRMFVRK